MQQPPGSSFRYQSRVLPPPISPLFQQQQIQELEHKVDVILLHNHKLIEQNAELHRALKLCSGENQTRKHAANLSQEDAILLRKELQIKIVQIDHLNQVALHDKSVLLEEVDHLRACVDDLVLKSDNAVAEKNKIEQYLKLLEIEKHKEITALREQLENQFHEDSLKRELVHKEQLREKESEYQHKQDLKQRQWGRQKRDIEEEKLSYILRMQEKLNKENEQKRRKIQQVSDERIKQIQKKSNQKIRSIKCEADDYLTKMIAQQKNSEEKQIQQLKRQIESLRQSLEERQKSLFMILNSQASPKDNNSFYYAQVQQMRNKLKEITENNLKQLQILKVKMAAKHEIDVRQMVQIYQNKIDILVNRLRFADEDNTNLRQKYEAQIRSKMKQRHKFEIQASRLKNYIRKMRVELESYGKQMRLNIEGIKDQANSFSMSVIGQLGAEKNKRGFYEEQNRKMREVIDLKQKEMDQLTTQCQEKVKYYQQTVKNLKNNVDQLTNELQNQQQKWKNQYDSSIKNARDQLKKQKEYNDQKNIIFDKEKANLKRQIENKSQNIRKIEIQKRSAQKNFERVSKQLEECKGFIDTMRLQMQMMGQKQFENQKSNMKAHYQRVIEQLEIDKQILKQTNSVQSSQLSQMISKYQKLQKSVQNTMSSLKKKTQFQQKVINLGMDNNLVKNLQQVFIKYE